VLDPFAGKLNPPEGKQKSVLVNSLHPHLTWVYTRPEKILGKRKNSNNIGSFFNPTGCCLSNKKTNNGL
jgi:hypothetical protein